MYTNVKTWLKIAQQITYTSVSNIHKISTFVDYYFENRKLCEEMHKM